MLVFYRHVAPLGLREGAYRPAINMSPLWGLEVGITMLVLYVVDLRSNETLQIGAVCNRTYRVRVNAMRFATAPTGLD